MNHQRSTSRDFFSVVSFWLMMILLFPVNNMADSTSLPGFSTSPWFDEQITTFNYPSGIRIHINAPSVESFDPSRPVMLILYALPNGNTIEQTAGKIMKPGDDWHYDIQHIAAQTRFLRQQVRDYNYVVVYLEARQKSWPAWKKQQKQPAQVISSLVAYLKACFRDYDPSIVLSGHSGGGRFIFSYIDAFDEIPDNVVRISFLDSNYGYEHHYGDKLIKWLRASPTHQLTVLAYNDSIALYNGKPFVSATGGTWYRSKMMQVYFAEHFDFDRQEDDSFIRYRALNGQIRILLKKNPTREIFHTIQVEKNGFIHSMLTGTAAENERYQYYQDRVYDQWIQAEEDPGAGLLIPLRSPLAPGGLAFMKSVTHLRFEDREAAIAHQISTGNIPGFLRKLKMIAGEFADANGHSHQVQYHVMPDYLAIGSDSDYCRIPMGPLTAQKLADQFAASLPTRKLVDHIHHNADIKLEPVTYYPVGNANERVEKFVEHHQAIEKLSRQADGRAGQLISGIKKDLVLSNLNFDPKRPNHVTIYGWHRLDGKAIQPQTNIHVDWYVDYSHGVRLLQRKIFIDGQENDLTKVLTDSVLYRILSDEDYPMPVETPVETPY